MDHLFANFGGKASGSTSTPVPAPVAPKSSSKKRPPSPTPVVSASDEVAGESASAKKLRQEPPIAAPVVTDDLEIEAKREVGGSVGLGGGEAEGLILSHAVSSTSLVSVMA